MIKPEDIIRAEFSRSFLGYDMKEVDTLLDAIIEQMEAWEKERSEMLTALEYLLHEIEQQETSADAAPQKRIAERTKAARIAQGTGDADVQKTASTESREKKRTRMKELLNEKSKAQPLPQAVSTEAPEPMQQIPLAKAHTEKEGAATFEIPTYVFAGTSGKAEETATVAEEIETLTEAAFTEDAASAQTEESLTNKIEQEA